MFFSSVRLTLLFFCFIVSVNTQASPDNPYIWQILTQYDLPVSNKTKLYIKETSVKVYSQDFQTVFGNKDIFGHNERLVLDLGDACNETTIEDIERFNGNWATSPSMMSQPSIGLVRRGGRCLKWSEKIANIQSLSNLHRLQVSGIVIHDDIPYNETTFIQEDTNAASYHVWENPLPSYRDIRNMTQENIIDRGSTFIAVYFVPYSYMDFLNQTLLKKTFENNGTRQTYVQLTFSLGENHFVTSNDPGLLKTSSDDTDNLWEQERVKRNYIIYSVTAIAILIIGYIMTRWIRAVRRVAAEDLERNVGNMLGNLRREGAYVIPFLKLEELCPILLYKDSTMTNSTCAICLDDFKDDFYVRVLPCHHGYCTACIDIWLTKKSSLCPICKYDCNSTLKQEVTPSQEPDPL